jgi:uncharacterized protein
MTVEPPASPAAGTPADSAADSPAESPAPPPAELPTVLLPVELRPLRLGELRPRGWLRDQLQLQVDGMAGHLDEFWPDLADSAWLGRGGEGWERGPYWLDGVVPLSFLVDDEPLRAKVAHWIGYIVEHQQANGWMGPLDTGTGRPAADPTDVWPQTVLLKALLQFYDGNPDAGVLSAAVALCRRIDAIVARHPLREWARVRWADLVWCFDQLSELTGDDWLLEAGARIEAVGYDWAAYAADPPYDSKVTQAVLDSFKSAAIGDDSGGSMNDHYLDSHGVNVAMGFKAHAVQGRRGDVDGRKALLRKLIADLDEHHGQATGVFTADEHLAGPSPSQGTETCAVVEYLFSLAVTMQAWGAEEWLADRWERLAYNALPASARPNDWGHQYDQQANQVACRIVDEPIYTNNGPDANTFGLQPHFGCCTANRHQGWPKFAARLWMRSADGGLTALSYAPCRIDTTVGALPVGIEVDGGYPFTDRIVITVQGGRTESNFPIRLRIPGWAVNPTVAVDDGALEAATSGTTLTLHRDWSGEHTITLSLPMELTVRQRPADAVSLQRGPIVYSLAVTEDWRQLGGQEPYGDWEVLPTSPWNYSLELDRDEPDRSVLVEPGPIDGPVFTVDGAPVRLAARATRLPDWGLDTSAAAPPPVSPVAGVGPAEAVTLLPYGAARLRITDLPWHPPAD